VDDIPVNTPTKWVKPPTNQKKKKKKKKKNHKKLMP
jgi:hypothetical protein